MIDYRRLERFLVPFVGNIEIISTKPTVLDFTLRRYPLIDGIHMWLGRFVFSDERVDYKVWYKVPYERADMYEALVLQLNSSYGQCARGNGMQSMFCVHKQCSWIGFHFTTSLRHSANERDCYILFLHFVAMVKHDSNRWKKYVVD